MVPKETNGYSPREPMTPDEVEAYLDSFAPKIPARRRPGEHIWDVIDRIMADVPEEELRRIPPSDHIDLVLYGTPLPERE